MKELFQLSCRCTKLKCGVIWAFVVMSAPGPWRELHLGPPLAAPRLKSLRAGAAGGRVAARLQLSLVSGAQLPSPRIIPDFGLLFCKVAGKNPWSRVAFFGLILQNMIAC